MITIMAIRYLTIHIITPVSWPLTFTINYVFNIFSLLSWQGELSVVDEPRRVIIQAVHELYDRELTTHWEDTARTCTMVFIGKNASNNSHVDPVSPNLGELHPICRESERCLWPLLRN